MAGEKLVGTNYVPADHVAKVTGRAKYAEDFRAEGMLFAKLLLSPMPHARVRSIDTSAALAMPGVRAIITADDVPNQPGEKALTNEPFYAGEPILAVAAVDEVTAADAIERIVVDLEPLPFVIDPLESLRPGHSERATRRQRVERAAAADARRAAWTTCAAGAGDGEVDRRGLRRGRAGSAPDGQDARGMVRRRPRRGHERGGARPGRDIRRAIHRSSPDGDAERDGLLAERQALSARLHAERRRHGRPHRELGRRAGLGRGARHASTRAAASAAKAPAPSRWPSRRCSRRRPTRP